MATNQEPPRTSLPTVRILRRVIVQLSKSSRWRWFFGLFTFGVLHYLLVDCLLSFKAHPDLPWYETEIYSGSPKGFLFTIAIFVFAIVQLLVRRD